MKNFFSYVDQNRDRYVAELRRLCRQPSIAAQNVGIRETAELVLGMLQAIGAQARLVLIDGGPPVVYGEIGAGPKTLTFYNHYDVQPADPLELWESEPFAAEIRDGAIYARGVADNKGDLMARIAAIDAYQKSMGALPLRIKFFIEGEEEVGSPHLAEFATKHPDLLRADGMIWEGSGKDIAGRPMIYLGMKGIAYFELHVRGAKTDAHSSWATLVPNPVWRLVYALNTLRAEDGRVLIDGLMEHVVPPSAAELEMLQRIPFEDVKLREDFGIPSFVAGLEGQEALRRHLYWPTCNIAGFKAGYIEQGVKTVLPNEAMVKIDIRLVLNLTPELVKDLLRKHLDRRGFTDVEIVELSSEHPAKSSIDSPIVRATVEAVKTVYGQDPVIYPLVAGTGPMYPLSQALGIPLCSGMGVDHARSRIHAPNENIFVDDYIQVIKCNGELIRRFAEM